MKVLLSTLIALLSNVPLIAGMLSGSKKALRLSSSFEVLQAAKNVDKAIENFESRPDDVEAVCMHPTGNYNFCVSLPEDIEETAFLFHPVAPHGLKLGDLTGTPDYDMAKQMIEAFKEALSCDDDGDTNVVTFEWLSEFDYVTPVKVVSYIKSFSIGEERYICSSGPLTEEIIRDEEELDVNSKNKFFPEFEWTEAEEGADYDFFGSLEFCGGKATSIENLSDFLTNQMNSNALFGYRQFQGGESAAQSGAQSASCGDDIPPLLRMKPGKTYRIHLINNSESDTNLYAQGLHLDGNGMSNDVFRTIPAGMCGVYIWDIPADHASGMHWYRPQKHSLTFEQVRGRAFGPIFIEEIEERLTTYPISIQKWLKNEVFLQMSSETVPSPVLYGDGVKDGRCEGGYDECYPRANSKKLETVTMIKDEWYAVNFNNVVSNGESDVIKFYAEDGVGEMPCEVLIAGYDGIYRSEVPRPIETYPEEPGFFHCLGSGRILFAMKCTDNASMKLAQQKSTVSHYGIEDPQVPIIVQFQIVEQNKTEASPYADESKLLQWMPPRPQYLEDLTQYNGDVETWDVQAEILGIGVFAGLKSVINDVSFNMNEPSKTITYQAVQEWSFYDTHTYAIHAQMNPMQILGVGNSTGIDCGPNFEYGEWYDTIRSQTTNTCKVRLKFNTYSGKVILQCQDFMYSDAGMESWIMVEGGPQDSIASDIQESVQCTNII